MKPLGFSNGPIIIMTKYSTNDLQSSLVLSRDFILTWNLGNSTQMGGGQNEMTYSDSNAAPHISL